MAIRTKVVEHIYADPNIYSATYSRGPSYKMGEALGAIFTMKVLQDMAPEAFESFRVLELFAGRSEHLKYISQHPMCPKIEDYKVLDIEASDDPHQLVGDALHTDLSSHQFNLIPAFFFSASSVMDYTGQHRSGHARSVLAQLYKNVFHNLAPIGAFSLDYSNNGYYTAMMAIKGTDEFEFDVPFFHPLRKEYDLPTIGRCVVCMKKKSTYNRLTSENIDYFVEPIRVEYEGEVVARVTVKKPFTQRYYSEPELVDLAHEAGFNKVFLLKNDYENNDYEVLDPVIELDDEEELDDSTLDQHLGNTLLAVKGVSYE